MKMDERRVPRVSRMVSEWFREVPDDLGMGPEWSRECPEWFRTYMEGSGGPEGYGRFRRGPG